MHHTASNPYQAPLEISEGAGRAPNNGRLRFPKFGLQTIVWSVVLTLVFAPALLFFSGSLLRYLVLMIPMMFFGGQVFCLFVPEGSRARKWAALSVGLHVLMWGAIIFPSMMFIWMTGPEGMPDLTWISLGFFLSYGAMLGSWACTIKYMGTLAEELQRLEIAKNANRLILFGCLGILVLVGATIVLSRLIDPAALSALFGLYLLVIGIATVGTSRTVVLAINEYDVPHRAESESDWPTKRDKSE